MDNKETLEMLEKRFEEAKVFSPKNQQTEACKAAIALMEQRLEMREWLSEEDDDED